MIYVATVFGLNGRFVTHFGKADISLVLVRQPRN